MLAPNSRWPAAPPTAMPFDNHDDDSDGVHGDRPAPRRLRLVAPTLRLAAASAVIAALSLYAAPAVRAPQDARVADAASAVAPRSAMPLPRAEPSPPPSDATPDVARLRLSEPGIDPVRIERGRLDPATGLREDGLSRGAFAALDAPALRLTLTRGSGAGRAPGLFVLLARRAADASGLAVIRTGAYGRVATKFGTVETVEATLSGPVERGCTAFVTREAAVRLDGWLCAPLGRAPERHAVACTLDALDLDDPADRASTAAFRAAPPRGPIGCDRPIAASDPAARTGSIARRARRTRK